MEGLTKRQRAVLGMAVQAFIVNAQPVSSQHVVETYKLKWSPATIRNELAALEEMGYLTHPHTSAGRIPTELGYRYYVENLLEHTELAPDEQIRINHQFGQARLELDQWLRLATSVVAQQAQTAALATPPRTDSARVKRIELVHLRHDLILLLLVLQEGRVREQMLSLDVPVTTDTISQMETQLNNACWDMKAQEVQKRAETLPIPASQIAGLVADTMQRIDTGVSDHLVREGLSHVFDTPEFADHIVAHRMMRLLEERPLLESLLAYGPSVGEVRVIIGGEGRWESLQQMSLIVSRYGVNHGPTGVLGVIGPLRMRYGHAISTIRYVGHLMSELVSDWYGANP